MNNNITIVTGLWDLGRGNIDGWAKRDFSYYKEKFFEMLKSDVNMVIWIPKDLEEDVWKIRKKENTCIFIKEIEDFKTWFPFFEKLQEIRKDPKWYNFAHWLKDSPQAALEFYNPMMMCKMFMVNDSAIYNPFSSDYFFWVDGGLTNTVHKDYFIVDKVFDNLENYCKIKNNKIIHLSYPYESNDEIHGFERTKMAEYCKTDFVNYVVRGGFFGGYKKNIHEYNALYYNILSDTINNGFMGADECLFTILCHRHPDLVDRYQIGENGLCWPFFEKLKSIEAKDVIIDQPNISLYVITYNSPKQFETLITSINQYDPNFLTKTNKYLLNNSIDRSTDERYDQLCEEYGFTEIHKDNIGICGGRQFIAEHFDESDATHYYFFEDDMFFYNGKESYCRNGFMRKVDSLYDKINNILEKENFDFIKLNFSEFFGDNSKQWAWFNVPQFVREEYFPNNLNREDVSDNNIPFTEFKNIKIVNGLPYVTGDIFYCNWPQIVSKEGNKKMFIDTKWSYPYEQTWMSHIFQLTKKNEIKPAMLLATPTEHNRFEHYKGEERREN